MFVECVPKGWVRSPRPLRCAAEASGFLVGPAVFKTVVGARAPRRVRFPSASAMPSRRSPLALVAAVVLVASLLLALTLPDREPEVAPCPIGRIDPTGRCGAPVDRRIPERVAIAIAGALVAAGLIVKARRFAPLPEPDGRAGSPPQPGNPA
jgi:hypothetical protein